MFLYLVPMTEMECPKIPVGTQYRILSSHAIFGGCAVMQCQSSTDGYSEVPEELKGALGTDEDIQNCVMEWSVAV